MQFDVYVSEGVSLWLQSYAGYIWLLVSLMFLFAELNTPGLFFFISFAVGAFCSSILAFLGYTLVTQCVSGLIVAIISFFLLRLFLKKKKLSETRYENPVSNIDAIVGAKGVVLTEIQPNGKGLVKIGGETWSARCHDDAVLPKGTIVCVVKVKGNSVIVSKSDNS